MEFPYKIAITYLYWPKIVGLTNIYDILRVSSSDNVM